MLRTKAEFLAAFSNDIDKREADVRNLLERVLLNDAEEQWRREIATMWLKKLDYVNEKWECVNETAKNWENRSGIRAINEAYMLRSGCALMIGQTVQVIYDSAVIVFSDYLRKEDTKHDSITGSAEDHLTAGH